MQHDTILIKNFRFVILKREANRILLTWTEKSGVTKERWIIINKELTWLK